MNMLPCRASSNLLFLIEFLDTQLLEDEVDYERHYKEVDKYRDKVPPHQLGRSNLQVGLGEVTQGWQQEVACAR